MSFSHYFPWQILTGYPNPLALSIRLRRDLDVEQIRREVDSVLEKYAESEQHGYYHAGGWTSIALVAANGDYREDRQLRDVPYAKTEALPRHGYLEFLIDSFDSETRRVRILNLKPKKNIFWHVDQDQSIDFGNARLHIPVYTNDKVWFQISHEDQSWAPGELWYGDFSFPHRLCNASESARIHIVADFIGKDSVHRLFPDSFLSQQLRRRRKRSVCQQLCRAYSAGRAVRARLFNAQ